MATGGNVIKTNLYTPDAWRVGQEPDAIMEALKLGEQVMGLFIQAATLIEQACQDVYLIIDNAAVWCQMIVDQLMRERARLAPVLTRLRAASRVVVS
jgi:hypothetical protein